MRLTLLVALFLLVAPAAASAATVRASVSKQQGMPVGPVVLRAAPGERNRVTVSGAFVFRDRGAPLVARGQCRQIDAHTARCPFTTDGAKVLLGDRGDVLRVRADWVAVYGGKGDDRLIGGRRADELSGGPGADTLRGGRGRDLETGGPGRDRVIGGDGDDALVDGERDGASAPDAFAGGKGHDEVAYAGRRAAVRIDLTGGTTTGDRYSGVEAAMGGRGDDVLVGDARANDLGGGPGDDLIDGGAGGDDIDGDTGRDVLTGGPGDDRITSLEWRGDEAADAIDCGDGADVVSSDVAETLSAACEQADALGDGLGNSVRAVTHPVVDADSADFAMTCDVADSPEPCEGGIELAGLGAAAFSIPPRGRQTVSVPLTPAAVAGLRAGRPLHVRFTSTTLPEGTRLEGFTTVLARG